MDTPSLQWMLRTALADARTRRGLTHDELATHARAVGLNWVRQTVSAIERGERDISLEEYALLPALIFRAGFDYWGPLPDFVPDRGYVQVAGVRLPAEEVRAVLFGSRLDSPPMLPGYAEVGQGGQTVELVAAQEAEQQAARKFGVDAPRIAGTALDLWGRGLTQERERRLTERTEDDDEVNRRVVRGHVTRELYAELEEAGLERTRRNR